MKDYSMDADSQKNYIVDFYEAPNRTLTVVYADGTHFTNIANTQENVNRIAEIQEALTIPQEPEEDSKEK